MKQMGSVIQALYEKVSRADAVKALLLWKGHLD